MRIDPYELGLWLMILGIPCSRALVEIGATTMIIAWLWRKWAADDLALRRSPLVCPLAVFFLWAACSLAWTAAPWLTLRAVIFQTLEYVAIYLAISDGVRDRRQIRLLLWIWLGWSVAMMGDGVIQLIRGADLIRGDAPGLIAGGARITGAMKYPNDFGAYVALTAMIAGGVTLAEWSARRRALSALAAGIAALNVVALILTFSRGAWLGLALAMLVALMFYRTRYAVPLLIAIGAVVAFLPAPYFERLTSIVDVHPGSASQERLLIWHSAVTMIREHPWLGFGLNTFNHVFPRYKHPAIFGTPYAHNCFLQLTAELGLIGLLAFGWVLLRVFQQGWRPALRAPWEHLASLGLTSAAAGYVVQSSVETNWYSLPLAVMWWATLGLADALNNLAEDRQRLFSQQIRRLIAVRSDRLGDLLMNLPALKALRQRFPEAHLTVMVAHPLDELLRGQPGINEVQVCHPSYAGGLIGVSRWALALRRGRFDAAVLLNPTKQAHVAAWLAGIPIRVGYARKWGALLTDAIPDQKTAGDRHEVDYNLELVRLLGATTSDRVPVLVVDPHDQGVMHALLDDLGMDLARPIVAIHPWTSDPAKQWPLESMAELIQVLGDDPHVQLALIGGPAEEERARHFLAGVRAPVTPLVGRLSLRQLAACLRQCQILLSNDSGPVHVAAAVGTATVTLFTGRRPAATPRRWGPVGAGHIMLTSHHPELPIPVEEVLAAVQRQLACPKPSSP